MFLKSHILKFFDQCYRLEGKILNKVNPPIIVLMYHRVLTDNYSNQPYTVTTKNFKDQINYLTQNYDIRRFEDSWKNTKRPSFVITFDDGYYDNYLVAKEFLVKNNIPSTFFISTKNIGRESLFWWDEIRLHWDTYKRSGAYSIGDLDRKLINSNLNQQKTILEKHRKYYKSCHEEHSYYRSMTEEELKSLADEEAITIGSHTVNHLKLSILSKKQKSYELESSKRFLEDLIGKKIECISYPYGYYDGDTISICKRLGYRKGATTVEKNCYEWTNQFKIPRFQVDDTCLETFKNSISRLVD